MSSNHWISGSGMVGCLYDHGPEVSETKEQAIEDLLFTFDTLGKGSLARMKRDLEERGIHYFDRRIRPFAGADYCEISSCDCTDPDHIGGIAAFRLAVESELKGCEAFSVGACPGCEHCGLSDEPSDNERELAEEAHFSWSACDSCGSTFGGDRHPAHYLSDGAIVHLAVCTDCLFYHANGDDPGEDWRQHP